MDRILEGHRLGLFWAAATPICRLMAEVKMNFSIEKKYLGGDYFYNKCDAI
jgi:hypothetical protein